MGVPDTKPLTGVWSGGDSPFDIDVGPLVGPSMNCAGGPSATGATGLSSDALTPPFLGLAGFNGGLCCCGGLGSC